MNINSLVRTYYNNFKRKDFCISLFTECEYPEYEIIDNKLQIDVEEVKEKTEVYYVGKIIKNKTNFFYIKEIGDEIIVDDLDPPKGDRYAYKSDKITIDSSLPNVDKKITTTYGKLLINSVLLIDPFNDRIPYVNTTPIDSSDLENLILKDVMLKKIEPDMIYKFFTNFDFISSLCELFVPSISRTLLSIPDELERKKADLFLKYKDQMDDPIIMIKIENELIDLDKKLHKNDESAGFAGKKTFEGSRKKMFSSFGAISDGEGGYVFAKSNLDEGWAKEDMPYAFNDVRTGTFGRAVNASQGGAETKSILQVFQDAKIVSEDCKTKQGIEFRVTEENKDQLIYRYIVVNEKTILVTDDNVNSYVGKEVLMRSPMVCKIKDNYCYKCCDYIWKVKGVKLLNVIPVSVTSSILSISMKAMHYTKLELYNVNTLDEFLF